MVVVSSVPSVVLGDYNGLFFLVAGNRGTLSTGPMPTLYQKKKIKGKGNMQPRRKASLDKGRWLKYMFVAESSIAAPDSKE